MEYKLSYHLLRLSVPFISNYPFFNLNTCTYICIILDPVDTPSQLFMHTAVTGGHRCPSSSVIIVVTYVCMYVCMYVES